MVSATNDFIAAWKVSMNLAPYVLGIACIGIILALILKTKIVKYGYNTNKGVKTDGFFALNNLFLLGYFMILSVASNEFKSIILTFLTLISLVIIWLIVTNTMINLKEQRDNISQLDKMLNLQMFGLSRKEYQKRIAYLKECVNNYKHKKEDLIK